jgi:predicted aconitase with swiveling domain
VGRLITGTPVVAGEARGVLLASSEPISFWGGYDFRTGEIIDRRHPLSGEFAAGKILAVPFSRGSSTHTAVFLEAVKTGAAPLAVFNLTTDSFFALASIVAGVMYGVTYPILSLKADDFSSLKSGMEISIRHDGSIEIISEPEEGTVHLDSPLNGG